MPRLLNHIRNHTNWLSYYVYKYFSNRKEEFTFCCRSGLKTKVPPRLLHTYKECFFDETYFKGFPASVMNVPPEIVLDIGANVGYFSLFMLSTFPKARVFAFEPMPQNFKLLSTYKNQNPLSDFNIFNTAISSPGKKSIMLNYSANDAYSTSAGIFQMKNQTENITVACTHLEEIIKVNNLTRIDFLKLDCEGSEYDILYNAHAGTLRKISKIAIETHKGKGERENGEALAGFLSTQDFEMNVKGDIIWAWRGR